MESCFKISGILIVIIAVLLVHGSTQSQSRVSRWILTSTSDDGTKLYLENNVETLKNGDKVRWVKYVMGNTYELELIEYDCTQRKERSLEYHTYDAGGARTYSRTTAELWNAIIPDSISEEFFEDTCLRGSKHIPLSQPKERNRNAPKHGTASSDDSEAIEPPARRSGPALGRNDLGVDYAIITASQANLREDGDTKSPVILQIPKGDLVVLLAPDPVGGWYNVVHIKSNEEGWIHTSTISTYFTKNRKPNIVIPSRETGGYGNPSLEVKNDSGKTMALKLGDRRYEFLPHESKTMTLSPGKYNFHASAPDVIPDFGEQSFQTSHVYTWRFYIVTVRR